MIDNRLVSLVAHVPVISRGYYDFLKQAEEVVDDALILDETVTNQFKGINKDIRRLKVGEVTGLMQPLLRYPIKPIGKTGLHDLIYNTDNQLYMPNDEVTSRLVDEYNIHESRMVLRQVFLRWDRKNTIEEAPIKPDKVIHVSDIPSHLIERLENERSLSTDWWRQVGCVVFDGDTGSIIVASHNTYVPSEDTAEIDGDIRSQSQRGTTIDNANAQHAEAGAIAEAAKNGTRIEGSSCLVNTFPCPVCAKLIVGGGVKSVYFADGYASGDGLEVLKKANIEIIKIEGLEGQNQTRTAPVPYL